MVDIEELKSALMLAGKLAVAARLVITADAKNLSTRIAVLENALDTYDEKIISFHKLK